jgi:hypothetical protein
MVFMIIMAVSAIAAGQTVTPPVSAPTPTPTPQATAAPAPAAAAPSIRVGVTIFADYTVNETPKVTDANGDQVTLSGFNLTRSYINVIGNVTSRVGFRLTPDIVRSSDPGSGLNGSLIFRVKFAYAQLRAGNETLIRLGLQPTPFLDGQDSVYRYRFQGTQFAEREAGLPSSDAGLTVLAPLPKGYGDVHVGLYNGEGFSKAEVNNMKALVMRATFRPMPTHEVARGLRLVGYYHIDSYAKDLPRTRAVASAMFEHRRLNAGLDYVRRVDQPTPAAAEVTGQGLSFFVTPFFQEKGRGVEGFFRFDTFDPDVDLPGKRHRLITGVAYWFPRPGPAIAAVLAHIEQVRMSDLTPMRTTERRFTLNVLINY